MKLHSANYIRYYDDTYTVYAFDEEFEVEIDKNDETIEVSLVSKDIDKLNGNKFKKASQMIDAVCQWAYENLTDFCDEDY